MTSMKRKRIWLTPRIRKAREERLMAYLRQSLKEAKASKLIPWEEAKRRLGL